MTNKRPVSKASRQRTKLPLELVIPYAVKLQSLPRRRALANLFFSDALIKGCGGNSIRISVRTRTTRL